MRFCLSLLSLVLFHPSARADHHFDFTKVPDRIWLGRELWANPMEDWRVNGGRLECMHGGPDRNVHAHCLETYPKAAPIRMEVRLGLIDAGKRSGSAGFRFGIQDEIDDYRARLLYGSGINAGITTDGTLFLGDKKEKVAKLPDLTKRSVHLELLVTEMAKDLRVRLTLKEQRSDVVPLHEIEFHMPTERVQGNLALVNNHFADGGAKKAKATGDGPRFWFADWAVFGAGVGHKPEREFGPILWATYTLSRGTLKMLAHMPPLGEKDSKLVRMQIKAKGAWKDIGKATIEPQSRTAQFKITGWDDKEDIPYRLVYTESFTDGRKEDAFYTGMIRRDPSYHKKQLVVAAFTGNADYGFPNVEIVRNLKHQDPDLLFFSGDQIYEYVGGYPLIRTPPDRAILNYLRKWYLVGLAFGDLCRDRPSIFIPDDHDVYQGNIWGNGGNAITLAEHERGGYVQHADFVNVVHRTQCGNLPDPFDPTPLEQNISVYYTDLVYGKVGFAVIADRMFKSGPKGTVSAWEGRPDHLKDPKFDVAKLDKAGLELLGKRQEKFLDQWGADWKGVHLKCVLSQTIFCNLANYHGPKQEYLVADLDSGGWPQSGRNRALDLMRRCFALHLAGDQHLASLVHHGIDAPGDAGWSFCVPSIANFYPRSWQPDKEGLPIKNRPEHGLPNTGNYLDGFKNHIRVHAIGNPEPTYRKGRLPGLHDKASGYGVVRFDIQSRTVTMECYRLLVDVRKPGNHQFPGWPQTIHMLDNYGRKPTGDLPMLTVRGMNEPVVQVVDEKSKEVVYTLRLQTPNFRPMVFSPGPFTVHVGELGTEQVRTFKGVIPMKKKKGGELVADFTGK